MLPPGKKRGRYRPAAEDNHRARCSPAPAALIYSISGGVLAYIVMCLLVGRFPEKLIWVVSAAAAVAHNAGAFMACALIVKTPGSLYYAPVLAASGIITGVFTGVAAMYLVRAVRKIIKK